ILRGDDRGHADAERGLSRIAVGIEESFVLAIDRQAQPGCQTAKVRLDCVEHFAPGVEQTTQMTPCVCWFAQFERRGLPDAIRCRIRQYRAGWVVGRGNSVQWENTVTAEQDLAVANRQTD